MFFHDETGKLWKMPASWTDIVAEDPFVAVAAGRAPFRAADLLKLATAVNSDRHTKVKCRSGVQSSSRVLTRARVKAVEGDGAISLVVRMCGL